MQCPTATIIFGEGKALIGECRRAYVWSQPYFYLGKTIILTITIIIA